ncbi:MAG: UDP-N-acetylglucosamine 1-carboxyvinyltransferase, partial [bacterium]|nr:UDP-N-acetylglucosamine 1-carboxyvinyltransferase [bacterium]
MHKYLVEGGFPIKGKIKANGNKNAALPCIAAALLTDEEVSLKNIPEIEDVHVMLEILEYLGCTVKKIKTHEYTIKTNNIKTSELPSGLCGKVRASILFAGPILARTGKVVLPPPGGDVIGRRRLDTHFIALSELGARVEIDGVFKLTANKLKGEDIFLDEASVTATENAIMAAVLAEGETILSNCASEPHVQDLCNMLNKMGADISGIGSNIIRIKGKEKLKGTDFTIGADFMEVGSLIGLCAVTRGELEITNADPHNLRMAKLGFNKLGINWMQENNSIFVPSNQKLKVVSDIGGS